jgi:hypothetical protein
LVDAYERGLRRNRKAGRNHEHGKTKSTFIKSFQSRNGFQAFHGTSYREFAGQVCIGRSRPIRSQAEDEGKQETPPNRRLFWPTPAGVSTSMFRGPNRQLIRLSESEMKKAAG